MCSYYIYIFIYIFERYGLSVFYHLNYCIIIRILVDTLFSCIIRELWLCVIFPHVKFITPLYQNIFPFHNLVCYDIVTPSF